MTKASAVILAAGRGSRMKDLTAARPKCLVKLGGKPFLEWQLQAMRKAGIANILVVAGYLEECLQGEFKKVTNPRWESTNMLASLLCSAAFIDSNLAEPGSRMVVSYSDIVYATGHVKKIMAATAPIAITYDTEWAELWKIRFENPLDDAETFLQTDGWLREIGNRPVCMEQIQGQYMGLLSFDAKGWTIIRDACADLGQQVDKTDMTSFLKILLARGAAIQAVPVAGQWCETDSQSDLEKYRLALSAPNWKHDWREQE